MVMTSHRLILRTWPTVALLLVTLLWSPLVATCGAGTGRPKLRTDRQRKRARPALARLSQTKVTAGNDGVLIEWRTDFEIDNLGFNVYRERNGQRTRLNPGIIAGSALLVGQGTPLQAGFSYSWLDRSGTLDSKYHLEDVDLSGQSTWHEAGTPEWSSNLPKRNQSQLLSDLGAGTGGGATQTEWAGPAQDSSIASANGLTPATIADQWAIANQPGLKIGVNADGFYRITQPEMAAAGFDTSADAANLRMFAGAVEIAIRVSRDSGPLTSADYVEFWGQRLDTPSTDTQIYWLMNGAQAGKRIARFGELHTDVAITPPPAPIVSPSPGTNSVPGWFSGIFEVLTGKESRAVDTAMPQSNGNATTGSSADHSASSEVLPVETPANEPGRVKTETSTTARSAAERALPVATDNATVRSATPESNSRPVVSSPKRSVARRSARKSQFLRSKARLRKKHRRDYSKSRRSNHANVSAAAAPAFIYTVELKDRVIYYPAAPNGEAENFFGHSVTQTSNPFTMTVHNVETTSTVSAQLQVSLFGVTSQAHKVNAFVNGSMVGTIQFSSVSPGKQTLFFPASLLVEGDNQLQLVATAGSNDVSLTDYLRLVYPHSFKADNNSLQFSIKATQSARLEGFTAPNIRVLDLSDLSAVQEVRPIVQPSNGGFAVEIPAAEQGKARRLIALPDTQLLHPVSLTLNQSSNLHAGTNGADLLIIAYKDFIPALAPLVAQRQAQGFSVVVANVDDVYDEFSYGAHTPQAIKDFLSLTRSDWSKAPSYLMLVGDASIDPRDYMGKGKGDFVPTKPVDTFYMEASSDDSLADFNNDGVPEISVGRLPARTVAEANLIVSKIVNFSPANVPQSALMVADKPIDYDFEYFSEQLIPLLPGTLSVQRVYRAQQPSDAVTRTEIINKFNSGQVLVNYSGHGNIDIWGGSIFTSNDALALTNGNRLSFAVVMDCLNGFFADPTLECLAESLLKAPNGGAVASFASSGLTIADPQHAMGKKMFQLLYSGPSIAIGDASRQSKSGTNDLDVRRTWILFGDPTLKIR